MVRRLRRLRPRIEKKMYFRLFWGDEKEDLRIIASDIIITIDDKMTISNSIEIFEICDIYKNKEAFVT